MIGAVILMGALLVIASLALSMSLSYVACIFLNDFLKLLAKYVNLRRVFIACIYVLLTHLSYRVITDYILVIFE